MTVHRILRQQRSRILIFTPDEIEDIIDFDFADESADSQINRRPSLMAVGNWETEIYFNANCYTGTIACLFNCRNPLWKINNIKNKGS